PPRKFSPERVAALREEGRRDLEAELERAARPAERDLAADQDDVDDHADEADDHEDDVDAGGRFVAASTRETPQEVAERRASFLAELRASRAKEGASAATRREAAQDQVARPQQDENRRLEETPAVQHPLSALLEERGPLLSRIGQACCPAGVTPQDFEGLKIGAKSAITWLRAAMRREGTSAVLSHTFAADPVLRFVLSQVACPGTSFTDWKNRAFRQYVEQPAAYDAVLGEVIPEDFRDEARRQLKQLAYDRGTNASALDDYGVFLERAERRRKDPLAALTTGLRGLDAALGSGLRGAGFLGGVAGLGKTSLCRQIGGSALAAHQTLAALFVVADTLSKEAVFEMQLSAESGVPLTVLRARERDEATSERLGEAVARLRARCLGRLR